MSETRKTTHIRWMIRRDMQEVMAIENECFAEPWSESDFVKMLRQRNVIGMVIELEEEIAGFMIYSLEKTELVIDDVAVHPKYQRQGLGKQMIQKLIGKLSEQRRSSLRAVLVDENQSGNDFFRAMGFKATRVLRSYYDHRSNDAIELRLSISKQGAC